MTFDLHISNSGQLSRMLSSIG